MNVKDYEYIVEISRRFCRNIADVISRSAKRGRTKAMADDIVLAVLQSQFIQSP